MIRNRHRFAGTSYADDLVRKANACEAVRRALKEAASWWRRGPVILLRARLVKQLATPITPVSTSATTRINCASIENSAGSGGGFTSHQDAGRGARDSGTAENVEVGVVDGDIEGHQAREAGNASDKEALRGVLEHLIALGNEEDGVFREIIMFV